MGRGAFVGCVAIAAVAMSACSSEDADDSNAASPWMSAAPSGAAAGAGASAAAGVAGATPSGSAGATPVSAPMGGSQAGAGGTGAASAPPVVEPPPTEPACASGDADADADGAADCVDACPEDPLKTDPGACGCGQAEPAEPGGECSEACAPDDVTCAAEEPGTDEPEGELCVVEPITDALRDIHGDVYTRYASARGVPILATDSPQDEALRRACMMVRDLGQRPDILETMLEENIGLVVMGVDETSADFPEFAAWGVPDWRARGLGGVPRGLCAEENVMCDTAQDRWRGESICVHEFSHTMHLGVYNVMDRSFDGRVDDAYRAAMAAGKFANTYAASNAVEYFAEGVQDWYNTNLESARPDGVHNEINTRAELEAYDPGLYELLAEVLPDEPGYVDCYDNE